MIDILKDKYKKIDRKDILNLKIGDTFVWINYYTNIIGEKIDLDTMDEWKIVNIEKKEDKEKELLLDINKEIYEYEFKEYLDEMCITIEAKSVCWDYCDLSSIWYEEFYINK